MVHDAMMLGCHSATMPGCNGAILPHSVPCCQKQCHSARLPQCLPSCHGSPTWCARAPLRPGAMVSSWYHVARVHIACQDAIVPGYQGAIAPKCHGATVLHEETFCAERFQQDHFVQNGLNKTLTLIAHATLSKFIGSLWPLTSSSCNASGSLLDE